MTAINAVSTGATGYVLADCADYDENGKVFGLASKIMTLPHAAAVCGARGQISDCRQAQDVVASFQSYDEMIQKAPPVLACIRTRCSFDVVVVGWSERAGRVAAAYASSDRGLQFEEADVIAAPLLSESELASIGIVGRIENPQRDLLRIMEFQKASTATEPRDKKGIKHVIGGAAVLTVVTRDTIAQRVIYRWPDKLGERIIPIQAAAQLSGLMAQTPLA